MLAILFAVLFAWSCKKEKQEELINPTNPGSSGELKSTTVMIFADSVSTTNVAVYSPNYMRGESFITPVAPAPQMKLSSVAMKICKVGNPTGYAKVFLYSTGTWWGMKPSGPILATTDSINVATFPRTGQKIFFNCTGANRYLMGRGSTYFAVLCFKGGNSSNYVRLFMDNTTMNTDGSHVVWALSTPPNYGWVAQLWWDATFWVYATY